MPPVMSRATTAQAQNYRVIRAASGDAAEIYIYGQIGGGGWFSDDGITSDQFAKDLKALGKSIKTLDVRISSEGGDVFQGKAIYNLLAAHPAKVQVYIDGLAASAASFIAMAGDTIEIGDGAFIMIHNAQGFVMGDWQELERVIALLQSVDQTMVDLYAGRTGLEPKEVKAMMDAETWMSSKEALAKGFVDTVASKPSKVAACVRDPKRYRNLPAALRPNRLVAQGVLEELRALEANGWKRTVTG